MLNDCILTQIDSIAENAILELGAGNGYFAPLLLRRFSGQLPTRLVITDQSQALLTIAQTSFHIDGAEYCALDVQDSPFGFFAGYLWTRYRNAWINVLLHLIVDAIPLVLLVAGAPIKPA